MIISLWTERKQHPNREKRQTNLKRCLVAACNRVEFFFFFCDNVIVIVTGDDNGFRFSAVCGCVCSEKENKARNTSSVAQK
jgi:hypothetical protein